MTAEELIFRYKVIGGQEAAKSTDDLIKRQKELLELLRRLPREGTEGYEELDAAIREASDGTQTLEDVTRDLRQEFAAARNSVLDFNRELRQGDAAAGSISDLRNKLLQMQRELDRIPVTLNGEVNPAFEHMAREVRQARDELLEAEAASGRFQRNVGNYPQTADKFTQSINQIGASIVGVFAVDAIVGKVTDAFRSVVDTGKAFTSSLSNLSSITGATGEDLQFMADEAQRLGRNTTQSASEVLEGFKLVGSAKPELLESSQALSEVTEKAITLAEAATIEVPDAVTALTTTLNQFGLGAEEAGRAIDVLAAGSLSGASDINATADALQKFGTVAASADISIEQSVASIETLAEKGLLGAEAGTKLRNIFITLQSEGIGVKDGVFDLSRALEELAPIQDNITELTAVFGKENVTAAQILVQNTESLQHYTEAVSQSGVALSQATTNVDNLEGDLLSLDSAIESLEITLFSEFEAGSRSSVQSLRDLVVYIEEGFAAGIDDLLEPIKEYGRTFREVFSSIGDAIGSLSRLFGTAEEGQEEFNALDFILKAVGRSIQAITLPIKAVAAVVSFLADGIASLADWLRRTIDESEFLSTALNNLQSWFNGIINAAQYLVDVVGGALSSAWEGLGNAISNVADFFRRVRDGITDFINESPLLLSVAKGIQQAFEAIASGVRDTIDAISSAVGQVGDFLSSLSYGSDNARTSVQKLVDTFGSLEAAQERLRERYGATKEELDQFLSAFDQSRLQDLEFMEQVELITAEFESHLKQRREADAAADAERLEQRKKTANSLVEVEKGRGEKELEEERKHSELLREMEEDRTEGRTESLMVQLQTSREIANAMIANQQRYVDLERELNDQAVKATKEAEEAKRAELELTAKLQQQLAGQLDELLNNVIESAKEEQSAEIDRLKELSDQKSGIAEQAIENIERQYEAERAALQASIRDKDQLAVALDLVDAREKARIGEIEQNLSQEQAVIAAAQQEAESRIQRGIEFQRRVEAFQSVIDNAKIARDNLVTLSNFTKGVSQGAALPFPASLIAMGSIVAAVASAISSIRQISKSIQASRSLGGTAIFEDGGEVVVGRNTVPRRRKGEGGMHFGPRHSAGGHIIEVEGGEFEINREATKMYLPILRHLNAQGLRRRRGLPLTSIPGFAPPMRPARIFEDGGLTGPFSASAGLSFSSPELAQIRDLLSESAKTPAQINFLQTRQQESAEQLTRFQSKRARG